MATVTSGRRFYRTGAPGSADHPKMMTVGLHARLQGRPGRIGALHRILDYMAGFERVWITRREDIARHWMAVHPAG